MPSEDIKIRVIVDGAEQAKGKLSAITGSMTKLASTVAISAVAMKSLKVATDLFLQSADEARKGFVAWKQIQTTLNGTGRAAQITADEINGLAGSLQLISNFGDEDIMQNATLNLLRFDKISTDTIPRATKLVLDMSAATGDLANNSRTLGIALNNPILGMSRLRRSAVEFSDAQVEMIKNFVETGRITEAQSVLMDALEAKFPDLATASIDATTQLKNAWTDYLQFLGQKTAPVIDGIKTGLAIFFMEISDLSANSTKEILENNLRVQKDFAIKSASAAITAKSMFEVVKGWFIVNVEIVKTIVDVVTSSIRALLTWIANEIVKASANLIRINPLNAFLQANKLLLEQVFRIDTGRALSWMSDYADNLERRLRPISEPVDVLTDSLDRARVNITNVGGTIVGVFRSVTSEVDGTAEKINTLFDEMQKVIDSNASAIDLGDLSDFNSALDNAGESAVDLDKKLRKAEITARDAFENLRRLQNEVAANISSYYNEVRTLDSNYYNWKIEQINKEVQAMIGLTDAQKDLLTSFRLNALKDEVDVKSKAVMESVKETATGYMDTIQNTLTNGFTNAFDGILFGAKSFKDSMVDLFNDMVRQLIAEIVKLAVFNIFTMLLGGGGIGALLPGRAGHSGIVGVTSGGVKGGSFNPIQPTAMTIPSGGSFNSVEASISRLTRAIETNRPQIYTQVIEGVPFYNAVERARLQAQVL